MPGLGLILAIQLNHHLSKTMNDALSALSVVVPSWDQETERYPSIVTDYETTPSVGQRNDKQHAGSYMLWPRNALHSEEPGAHVLRLHKSVVFIVYHQTAGQAVTLDFQVCSF